jgi:hypothetical protein
VVVAVFFGVGDTLGTGVEVTEALDDVVVGDGEAEAVAAGVVAAGAVGDGVGAAPLPIALRLDEPQAPRARAATAHPATTAARVADIRRIGVIVVPISRGHFRWPGVSCSPVLRIDTSRSADSDPI